MRQFLIAVLVGVSLLFGQLGLPAAQGGPHRHGPQLECGEDAPQPDWADSILENREQIGWIAVAFLACLAVGVMGYKVLSTADALSGPKTARRLRPPNDVSDQIF
jgi:hypothetical protein